MPSDFNLIASRWRRFEHRGSDYLFGVPCDYRPNGETMECGLSIVCDSVGQPNTLRFNVRSRQAFSKKLNDLGISVHFKSGRSILNSPLSKFQPDCVKSRTHVV